MTQVSSDLEIVAVRASYEAVLEGDAIGRSATNLFNQLRDRTVRFVTLLNSTVPGAPGTPTADTGTPALKFDSVSCEVE